MKTRKDKIGVHVRERTVPYKEESMTNSPKEEPGLAVPQVECPLHEPIFFQEIREGFLGSGHLVPTPIEVEGNRGNTN
jgi:hypothetical protein